MMTSLKNGKKPAMTAPQQVQSGAQAGGGLLNTKAPIPSGKKLGAAAQGPSATLAPVLKS